ncbi:MAG TPA: thiamine-phosphate kinase [Rhizomicrobium sp.]|nr:thiamine-phosphate kinase [Rhizomicrobium sp.]
MTGASEFDLIAKYFAPLAGAGAFELQDDAATIAARPGTDLVVTTDTLIAGVDFFEGDPPESIARKALRVNLSDLAAKGAEPWGYLLSLSLPGLDEAWLDAFARGLQDDQERFEIVLLGGDTGATPGPLSVAITAFGHVPEGQMIRRGSAWAGNLVFVTGTIGDSGGGLALLKGDGGALDAAHRNVLIDRYRLPDPPVALGPSLRRFASAAIDVSDGLLADLGHVAEASGMRIIVEGPSVPRSPALEALWGGDIVRAATAGDDYQIAFTAPARHEAAILEAGRDAGTRITRIGRVEAGAGIVLLDAQGHEVEVARKGFTHF